MLNTPQATTARNLGITVAIANRQQPIDRTTEDAEYLATAVANLTAMDAGERLEFIDRTVEHAEAAREAHAQRQGATS